MPKLWMNLLSTIVMSLAAHPAAASDDQFDR
jgi:hypothetical protein